MHEWFKKTKFQDSLLHIYRNKKAYHKLVLKETIRYLLL